MIDIDVLKFNFDYFNQHGSIHESFRDYIQKKHSPTYTTLDELKKLILDINENYNYLINDLEEKMVDSHKKMNQWIRFKQFLMLEELDTLQDLIEDIENKRKVLV